VPKAVTSSGFCALANDGRSAPIAVAVSSANAGIWRSCALAASAKPRMLILYHFTAPAARGAEVTAAIRNQGYAGRIVIGKDLDRY